jgi:hypothetical protein
MEDDMIPGRMFTDKNKMLSWIYSFEANAQTSAELLNADAQRLDGARAWSYKVEPMEGGFVVVAFDETGFRLGTL